MISWYEMLCKTTCHLDLSRVISGYRASRGSVRSLQRVSLHYYRTDPYPSLLGSVSHYIQVGGMMILLPD
jgi:hypothetical protein